MNGADIRFVHLGITIEHLKSSISVFGFRIAFYGIIIGIVTLNNFVHFPAPSICAASITSPGID